MNNRESREMLEQKPEPERLCFLGLVRVVRGFNPE
jgi:hypothetical protein